jgi:hypothetical protein
MSTSTVTYTAEYEVFAGWVVNESGTLYWSEHATRDNRGVSEPEWYVEFVAPGDCKGHLPSAYLSGETNDDYSYGFVTITAEVALDEFGDPDLCGEEWQKAQTKAKTAYKPRKNTFKYDRNGRIVKRSVGRVKSPNAW